MSEGRKTQVVLLDERRLEILVQPKLYTAELLDMVASHFSLKEKEYFGLSFKDDTGHHHWLQLDRKVLDHEYPKKSGPLVIYFAVRFFIESIGYLRDNATIELFYQQAKQGIFRETIESNSEIVFELAAHVLQANYGDYTDDVTAKAHLKKLPVLPTSTLQEHPSISYCEDQVLGHYRKLAGTPRGSAIVNYMTIVESLPTYGIHYYEVKDKSHIPWWLGLSYKGISQYDHNDKKTPRKVFAWKQLENLYFRDKKFSIEVHDPKRVSVSRRTFGPGGVNVYAWFAANPSLTKCIWSVAVSQHQFYLDRKQSKSQLPAVRSMSEIAADLSQELSQSTNSLPSSATSDSISRSDSAHSLSLSTHNSKIELTVEQLEQSRAAQRDMYAALKARKEALEEALRKKTELLKKLCIDEAELTGILPPETPLYPGEQLPQIRKRVGTAFSLSPQIVNRNEEDYLGKLELEYDLQDKIAKAALKLAKDTTVAKSVRKQRKQSYQKSHYKLKDLEKKLNEARRNAGITPLKHQPSIEDLSADSEGYVDSEPEFGSPLHTPATSRSHLARDLQQVKIVTSPKVEVVEVEQPRYTRGGNPHTQGHRSVSPGRLQTYPSRGSTPSPQGTRRYAGYTQNSVYSTRTQIRNQMYPTVPFRNSQPPGYEHMRSSNRSPQRGIDQNSISEQSHNLYNIETHRTARYDSADELKSPNEDGDGYYTDSRQYPQHGSLDRGYSRIQERNQYSSLDRNHTETEESFSELTPSKFGSKRESHSDYRDSPYQPIEMPPVGEYRHQPSDSVDGYYPSHSQQMAPGVHSHHQYEHNQHSYSRDYSYSDGSSSSYSDNQKYNPNTSSGSGPWYGGSGDGNQSIRQQQPPNTPQYESPPFAFVQEPDQVSYRHDEMSQMESPQYMTIKQSHGYREFSKPFQMSDVYKYSEKLRKQRHDGNPQDSQHSPQPPQQTHQAPPGRTNVPPSPYMSSARHINQNRPSSPYMSGNRSRSESPYSHQQDGSYNVNSRPHYGGQSGQPQYQRQQSPNYSVQQHNSQNIPYQPPQPMTCEPMQDRSTANTPQPPHRSISENYLVDPRNSSRDNSFPSFDAGGESLADGFKEEMLAWYDDNQEQPKSATVV